MNPVEKIKLKSNYIFLDIQHTDLAWSQNYFSLNLLYSKNIKLPFQNLEINYFSAPHLISSKFPVNLYRKMKNKFENLSEFSHIYILSTPTTTITTPHPLLHHPAPKT